MPDSIKSTSDISSLEDAIAIIESQRLALEKAEHERNEYKKLYDLVFLELERMRRHLFGKKSERVADEQLPLSFLEAAKTLEAFEEEEPTPIPNSRRKKTAGKGKKRSGRKPLPEHLPVERIELPVPAEVEADPDAFKKIGEDVSETLERRPATLVRVQIVRPKFARKGNDAAGVIASALPTKPIEKGLAGPGLLAYIIISKYADHIPLNRQEGIFAREKIVLGRSTLCGWIKQAAELPRLVYDVMWKDAMNAHCIATDATGVLVQAPEQCIRGHFFVCIADREHVLYKYTRHHNSEAVNDMLGHYKGFIIADAHIVYDQLFRDTTERIESGCFAHGRRYFYDALTTDPDRAMVAIRLIGKLFEIEREIADKTPDIKEQIRLERSKPITDKFFKWCDAQWPLVIEETPIFIALRYARNQREALCRFLDDGQLPIHNNFSELQLRSQVIGRRNWLFLGSEDGGEWNCIFTSLIASCRLHDIEPWGYLRDLLILLPDWPRNRVLELSPKFWKQTLEQSDAQQRLAANPFWRLCSIDS
ncbi:MAG: IS66 family transposase [Myxococcota bacterium]|nr:IS66 family transposase [Myxococcota bacterium]